MATSVEHELAVGREAHERSARERLTMWGLIIWLAPFAVALLAYLTAYDVMNPSTSGDEPHYLLVAESLAFDGDLDLTNDYASKERTLRVVNVYPLSPVPHAADYTHSGQLRPLHGVGLSALLAPAVGLGGLTGARLMMVLIAALLAHQLYRLLMELGFRRRYRIGAWVATAFCMPILAFSSQIYPELPAALIVLVVLRVMIRGRPSPVALALASTASAALVWLHVRYFPISVALLLGLAYVATSDRTGEIEAGGRGLRTRLREAGADLRVRARSATRQWRTVALPVFAPYAAVLAVFFLAFWYWYGSPDPRTPYYAYSTTNVGSGGWKFLYNYGLHDLFNPLAGWIPFAPVHWLGLAALGCVVVWFGWPAVACIAAAAGYEVILASAGPAGGWGLPARYLIIVIPLIAVPLALVIQQIRLARYVFVPLLAGSLILAMASVRDYLGLYPVGERQTIPGLRSIATAFPVTLPAQPAQYLTVAPGQAKSQTGRVQGDRIVASAGRDKPGFLLYGTYGTLKSGAYRTRFSLASPTPGVVALVEVVGQGTTVLARESIRGQELERRRLTDVTVSFATPGDVLIEPRIYYYGRGTLSAGPIQAEPLTATAGPPGHFRDWPLAFLWIGGTVLIGALFVQVMNLSGPRPAAGPGAGRSPPRPAAPASDGNGAALAVAVQTWFSKPFAGPRPFSRAWVHAHREALVATTALGGVFVVAAIAYWWTHAPLYNPSGTIDPWLYTALFVNFDQFYDHFKTSYYASRLPWIVPARMFYGVFPVDAAYWLVHGLAFVGGVSALFALVRRYIGLAAAVVGAATLALSPMYWNSQYWDYVDGITITYVLAGLCFGLPRATGSLRSASLVVAGIFFAAAVTTNLFAGLVALIYPILYAFLQAPMKLRGRLLAVSKDLAALLIGAAALVIALGLYARAYGGQFLYWKVQLDLIRSGAIELTQLPGNAWVRSEPRLLAPVFLIAVTVPLLAFARRLPPFRFACGSLMGLVFLVATLYTWQFLGGGNSLELPYYFSYFSIPIALTTASLAALAVSLVRSRPFVNAGVAVTVTMAALVPLGLLYHDERQGWTGKTGMKISLALAVLAALVLVGFIATRRTAIGTAMCLAAVGAVALAAHFSLDSSSGTFVSSYSAPQNRNLYHAAMDEVAFVKRSSRPDDSLPAFWYPGTTRADLISVQSMYYFGWTAIALELPTVTKEMRERLALWNPQTMVMLCEKRDCGGGTAALRRAGFPYKEENATLISRGGVRFWSVFLRKAAGA